MSDGQRRLLSYLIWVTLPVMLLSYSKIDSGVDLSGPLKNKVLNYRAKAANYDVVFVGDSRTYCGIQPPLMSDLLGGKVANLAYWAHWLPTQYAQLKDLVAYIPKDTTVVWSVGYQNFFLCEGCSTTAYPIGQTNAELYAQLDLPVSTYEENIRTLTAVPDGTGKKLLSPFAGLYQKATTWLNRPLYQPGNGATTPAKIRIEQSKPGVARVEPVYYRRALTSLSKDFVDGGHERIELDREFFRTQQRLDAQSFKDARELESSYLGVFTAGLQLLADHNINVVINIMEEAPHKYASDAVRQAQAELLRNTLKPLADEYGYPYVHIDFGQLSSADYFDYNHLNSRGAKKFAILLADELNSQANGSIASAL